MFAVSHMSSNSNYECLFSCGYNSWWIQNSAEHWGIGESPTTCSYTCSYNAFLQKLYRYSSCAEGPNATLAKMGQWGEAVETRNNGDVCTLMQMTKPHVVASDPNIAWPISYDRIIDPLI